MKTLNPAIKESNLYQKRKHFIVQFRNAQDNLLATGMSDDGRTQPVGSSAQRW
ncbi:hypothetical protein AB6809_35655 [Paraburkholderia sp. RCC_158]|uniref:hypothetical protein n=1 Tax=Paraburkholderia sp. RCC_158 TaxID=3239220 RepID=UPI003524C60B